MSLSDIQQPSPLDALRRLDAIQESVRPERRIAWRSGDSFNGAFRAAWRSLVVGLIPVFAAVAMLAVFKVVPGIEATLRMPLNVVMLLACGVVFVLLAAITIGKVAHRFAWNTTVSVTTLALAMSWVLNFSLWGWIAIFVLVVLSRP